MKSKEPLPFGSRFGLGNNRRGSVPLPVPHHSLCGSKLTSILPPQVGFIPGLLPALLKNGEGCSYKVERAIGTDEHREQEGKLFRTNVLSRSAAAPLKLRPNSTAMSAERRRDEHLACWQSS